MRANRKRGKKGRGEREQLAVCCAVPRGGWGRKVKKRREEKRLVIQGQSLYCQSPTR